MSTQPEPAQREPRWQVRPETTPRDALIGMYAINEGDVAILDEIVDAITAAARAEVARLIEDGIEAFRLTREYVGEDTLPAIEGWSWFDWCERAKAVLEDAAPRQPEPETPNG